MANSDQSDAMRQGLSELMDGHADASQAEAACGVWRSNPHARECWHTYHLIGDVLRSDELAHSPQRDAAFLSTLRSRLAAEPIPLAPQTPMALPAASARRRWAAPAAAAAGFVAVAGLLVVYRVASPPAGTVVPVAAATGQPDVKVVSGQLIRDARLDRYLAAHRQVSNGAAVHVPGAVVRSVDTIVLENK